MTRHRLATLALALNLLAAPATSGMVVLCVGSDGHVAVESAGGTRCCEEWEAGRRDAPGDRGSRLEAAAGDCCRDVDLLLDSATLTVRAQKLIPSAIAYCSLPVPPAPQPLSSPAASLLSTETSVAASLRTVILRA